MTKLQVRDYSIYTPVSINRMHSSAFRTDGRGLALITEKPLQGSAFNAKELMDAIIYGPNAKYFV